MIEKPTNFVDKSVLALSITGLMISLWLTYLHVRVHLDPFYESVCAVGAVINCDTAAASPFSVFANLPVSIWGTAYYLVFAISAVAAMLKRDGGNIGIAAIMAMFAAAISVVYIVISIMYVDAVCVACYLLHLLNFAQCWICLRRAFLSGGLVTALQKDLKALRKNRWGLVQIVAFLILVAIAGPAGGFPRYWEIASFRGGVQLPHGFNTENVPWIGAEAPTITVDEYFDFECPACISSHKKLRRLLANRKDTLRVIRHDMSRVNCVDKDGVGLKDRCVMARAAFCAGAEQRFWEFNDAFLADPRPGKLHARTDYALELARQLGLDPKIFAACMIHPATFSHIEAIHQDGLARGIKSTPTYIMENKLYHSKEILPKIQSM